MTRKPPLRVIGTGDEHWPMVHVDDPAGGYLRAAESGVPGGIFNLTDGMHPTVRELVEAIARVAGYPGQIEYVPVVRAEPTLGAMAETLARDPLVDSSKAERRLGWRPRHRGFPAEVATYLAAWQARQDAGGTVGSHRTCRCRINPLRDSGKGRLL